MLYTLQGAYAGFILDCEDDRTLVALSICVTLVAEKEVSNKQETVLIHGCSFFPGSGKIHHVKAGSGKCVNQN